MHPVNSQSILTTLLVSAIGGAVHRAGAHDSPDTILASQQTDSAPDMADAIADDFDLQEDENAEAVETITERYPDGTTKISRQVTQDTDHNYVNHGAWTGWNQRGEKLSQGEFRLGRRHGRWTRLYTLSELRKANIPIHPGFEELTTPQSLYQGE